MVVASLEGFVLNLGGKRNTIVLIDACQIVTLVGTQRMSPCARSVAVYKALSRGYRIAGILNVAFLKIT
jgi:hypothetical protein